jgi:hypothetical protein
MATLIVNNIIGGVYSPTNKAKGKLNENIRIWIRRMHQRWTRHSIIVLDTIGNGQSPGYIISNNSWLTTRNANRIRTRDICCLAFQKEKQ